MKGFRIFNNSACKRVLTLLEAGYLRLMEVVVKRITLIKIEVNDESGNGPGLRLLWNQDKGGYIIAKLTNMMIAVLTEK